MLNTWIILIVAIAAETFATTMVRASEGFTRLLPSLGVVAGYAVSFYGLSQVVKVMNLGIAYAIWAAKSRLNRSLIRITVDHDFASCPITFSHGGRSAFRTYRSLIRVHTIIPGINSFLHGLHC